MTIDLSDMQTLYHISSKYPVCECRKNILLNNVFVMCPYNYVNKSVKKF